jgi:hypothetical protein
VEGVSDGIDNSEDVKEDLFAATQHKEEKQPQSSNIKAAILPNVKGKPAKMRRLSNDIAASLDQFYDSTVGY